MAADPVTRRRYRKRLEPSERRDSILDSALNLVTRLDSFSVTIAQIAEEEGVSKPVIYDHFANVDELLAALFTRERTMAVASTLEIIAERIDTDDPAERLAFAVERARLYLGLIEQNPLQWKLTLQPPLGLTPDARQLTERGKGLVRDSLMSLIAWAVPESDELDLLLTTHAVQAVIERMAFVLLTEPETLSIDAALEFAATHIGWWLTGRQAALHPE
jgi:AcrR family transcriptional regulator